MKARILILTSLVVAALTSSCIVEVDSYGNEIDHTLTAYNIYADVDEVLCSVTNMTMRALFLSSYLDATNDADRQLVEDEYFFYYKVRSDAAGNLSVYGQNNYLENYYASDNKSLSQDGASWIVKYSSGAMGLNKYPNNEVIVRRNSSGNYTIVFNKAAVGAIAPYGYYYYDSDVRTEPRYEVSGSLDVETTYFSMSGQSSPSVPCDFRGNVTLTDAHNSNFVVGVSIPVQLSIDASLGDMQSTAIYNGSMVLTIDEKVSGAHETIDAARAPEGWVSLKYTTADGTFNGLYKK